MLSLMIFHYVCGHPKKPFTHYEPVQLVTYVGDEDQHIINGHIYDPIFERMGFDGTSEYKDSYPGLEWFVSSLDKGARNVYQLCYDCCFPHIYISYMKESEDTKYPFRGLSVTVEATVNNFIMNIKNAVSEESLFSTVTIDEAKRHFVFKNEDPQDMWYCSDWKG